MIAEKSHLAGGWTAALLWPSIPLSIVIAFLTMRIVPWLLSGRPEGEFERDLA